MTRAKCAKLAPQKQLTMEIIIIIIIDNVMTQAMWDLVDSNPTADFDKGYLQLTPNASMEEFWLPLHAFDYSEHGKNGCGGVQKHVFDDV